MKKDTQFAITVLSAVILTACSSSPEERRQANHGFAYMETEPLSDWKKPAEAKPEFYNFYEIPKGKFLGEVAQTVDIRPPQQVLELVPGASVEEKTDAVIVWLVKESDVDKLWVSIFSQMDERGVKLVEKTDSNLETSWITWRSLDEDTDLSARYDISKLHRNNRYGLQIKMVDWRVAGKEVAVTPAYESRYNITMTNSILTEYDALLREEARIKAEKLIKVIPIYMGNDRSGFPIIIARSPYNVFWERVSELLPMMGFTIEDKNQSQGTIEVQYDKPDDEFWKNIDVKPLILDNGKFTLLLGDLGNRTSISISNAEGKPIDEKALNSIIPLFAEMIKKSNQSDKKEEVDGKTE